ncbi:MAG: hypothetical protein KF715_16400 [Candidatus Didemnitutus sp.]|nr:hypothetical protein [Candidatus Didemnitutus sp.]
MKPLRLFLLAVLGGTAVATTRADIDITISADIRLGRVVAPPPPVVEVVDLPAPKGPPPWARRGWFTRERVYYFYPEAEVYYRPADRMWFYVDHGAWRTSVELPTWVRVDLGHNVQLSMGTDRPFERHREVIVYYPRAYFTHVRVKGPPPRHAEPHGRDRDDDDRGHGHGKGRDRH